MRNLELLLFDMDGVLVDTASLLQKSYVELAEFLNARRPTQKEVKEVMPMSPKCKSSG
jgi:beta-phosphoglucomutase-like phosphatase (HAD superfamily)